MNSSYTEQSQIDSMREELDKVLAKPQKPNLAKIFGSIVFYLLVAFLIFVLVDVTIDRNSGRVPTLFGLSIYEIESNSMEPTFKVGSILVCQVFQSDTEISVGDVVTFKLTDGRIVTHRIVEVLYAGEPNECYRTKGDNSINSIDAEILTRDRILAVYLFKLPMT